MKTYKNVVKKKFSDDKSYPLGNGGGLKKHLFIRDTVERQEILGNETTGFNSGFWWQKSIPGTGSVMNSSGMIFDSNTGLKPINVVMDCSEYSPGILRTHPFSVLEPTSQQNIFDVSFNEVTDNINSEGELMIEGK